MEEQSIEEQSCRVRNRTKSNRHLDPMRMGQPPTSLLPRPYGVTNRREKSAIVDVILMSEILSLLFLS